MIVVRILFNFKEKSIIEKYNYSNRLYYYIKGEGMTRPKHQSKEHLLIDHTNSADYSIFYLNNVKKFIKYV